MERNPWFIRLGFKSNEYELAVNDTVNPLTISKENSKQIFEECVQMVYTYGN